MKKFIYSGAMATNILFTDGSDDITLHPGATQELQEDHPQVAGLIGLGLLAEVPEETPAPPPAKTETKDNKNQK